LSAELVALRRLHIAEAAHFPGHVGESWRREGTKQVQQVLEQHLGRLRDRGLLDAPDITIASHHLAALLLCTVGNGALFDFRPVPAQEIDRYVHDGVHAFLTIYGPA